MIKVNIACSGWDYKEWGQRLLLKYMQERLKKKKFKVNS